MDDDQQRAARLARTFLAGGLSRRDLIRRSARFGAGALAATALGPVLAACGSSEAGGASSASATEGEPVSGGTLTAALTGNPSSLDPASPGIYTSSQVLGNIFNTLVGMDEEGVVVPELATSWTEDDPQTYTFELVDGATFHNGEPFTAEDVRYTFSRIADPATASAYASSFAAISSIEATSPTTVVFHLSEPFAPLLTNLAQTGQIVNQKAIESSDPVREPVGTGPFQFVEWVQNDHITLEKSPTYFVSGQPYLDGVEFRFLDVNKSRMETLASGGLDWVDAVPLNQLTSLEGNPQYTSVTSSQAGIPDFLALNTSRPPFDDPALRQAVAAAVDREEILAIAYFGAGEAGYMEVPSGSRWFSGDPPHADGPDLAEAKKKLAEAGHPDGLEVTYLSLPQYPELEKTGVVLKDQLAKVGIDVTIEQLEVTVWFDRYAKGDYDMTSAYWAGTIDPDDFYSSQLTTGSPNNSTKYSNPEVDDLVARARATTDAGERGVLYEQVRSIVWDEAPLVFLHYETVNYLMRADVHGSTVNPPLDLRFGQVWKEG